MSGDPQRAVAYQYMIRVDMELVDGLCIAQVAMKEDVETAQGSFRDLRNAGNELLRRCVSLRSEGGVATNLGKDRSYALGYG